MQCSNIISVAAIPPRKLKVWDSYSQLSIDQRQTLTPTNFSDTDFKLPLPSHVTSITSTSNPFVKHCHKLRHSSSYRHSHGSALVVGATPIREICRFQKSSQEKTVIIDCLLLLDKAEVPEWINEFSLRIVQVSSVVMKKLSGMQSTESIEAIALMRIPTSFSDIDAEQKEVNCKTWFPSPHRVVVLDGVQDPGNLGTLLRSAMAFGWNGAFLLPGCCDPFNEKALRASRGASFQLPIVSGTWNHLQSLKNEFQLKLLAGHPGTEEKSKPVSLLSQKLADSFANMPVSLVLGSEGRGLSEKSRRLCELVSIPMAGEFESLNVSVAGGIFLYVLQPKNHTTL
ncbi:RNA methyltransferase-like protein 1B [Pyrus ussuriensis x Pyrus communis]|uniref:RNA methyltransferase-like protein 1B n=1 Tax=Pyrus ussuriensis x Pyrus communis TaxID=2448454 RepID=A0A5N5F8W9_9ROSA|nr:RNA methyltransferase-like protein 1B [Pyrus ussuriensis x Pyrus communis]